MAGPTPSPTCDQRCRDSIALAEKRRADSLAAAEEARKKAEYERAIAATKAALAAPVYFEYDSDELSGDARATLDAKLPIFRANPNLRIRVAGHTDERGSDEYNLALGQRRAAAVKRYLSDQGIDGGRMEIVSFGEERPAVTESNDEVVSVPDSVRSRQLQSANRNVRLARSAVHWVEIGRAHV